MTEAAPCPVPAEQRPLEEFQQLSSSWFFSWPVGEGLGLVRNLVVSWMLTFPVCTLVASGSWTLKQDPPRLIAAGAVAALVFPLLLLVRQWLGWSYVMKRLLDESVDYEESGWYDGQTWKKPSSWRDRDLLVARHEVRPILGRLGRVMATAASLMLGGASLCQVL
ncbi:CGLD27 family protein [Synechococcus sp. M16CYN]|uniref:CGLD27 family protein n=1 Tax=Synechococcus sp. M16CYN TaxID=3103139 RepID=UPI00324EEA2D